MAGDNGRVPAFVRKSEAYATAVAFMGSAAAKENAEYKWVLDYAKGLWEYRNKVFVSLDEKAESIIKYLGGGTGLFALGALAKVDTSNNYIAFSALPAIGAALLAILFALLSKMPSAFPGLPAVKEAKECADDLETENAATGAFLGQWNYACEMARLVCGRKARRIAWATGFAYVSLSLLLLPLLVAIYYPHG
jgi:hypothetical protein